MPLLCLILFLLPLSLFGQFTYTLDHSIPVSDTDDRPMRLAWSGGLNAAQFNTMDLNGDGTDDLVLYDRMANKIITFVAENNLYVPAPEYEGMFPEDLYNWVLLRDFNCDGRKDIFTGDVLGMKVYINTTSDGRLEWEPYMFSTGFDGPKSHVLLTKNPATGFKVNLQIQYDDLPSISDVDGDGDLDILNIQYSGQTIEFHQNLSVDNFQSCDSLEFVRVTRSWGSLRECDCGSFAFNNAPCPPNPGGRTKHAGGKSLLAIDLNGDQQQDLLLSEADCTQIYALPNKGTSTEPLIDSFYGFPQTNPVNFVLFPAAFYEDVDFDGKKDLIATPNIFGKMYLNSQLNESTWLYKNTGTTNAPTFSFVKRNFLQDEMIDVGDNAVPSFFDYNGDGLTDLLISSHSSDEFTSRVYLFENVGTSTNPSFKLASDDFLGFTAARYFNVKIQFVDIDNNQTLDLVFTATSFDNNATNLYYFLNKSSVRLELTGTLQVADFSITSTENVHLTDISGDGLPDIIVGRSEGNLEYWRNSGITGSPVFVLEDENYLGFTTSPLRRDIAVAVADLDADGRADLIVGDNNGRPGIISDFRNGGSIDNMESAIIYNTLSESYESKNLGGPIWPTVINLFNTKKPSIVLGNGLGGVHILKHDDGTSLPEKPVVDIYPNPALRQDILKIRADRTGIIEILSTLGQRVSTPTVIRAHEVYNYQLNSLAAGLYLLRFTFNDKSYVERFVVR